MWTYFKTTNKYTTVDDEELSNRENKEYGERKNMPK